MIDAAALTSIVVSTITPLLPYLSKAVEIAGKGVVEAISKAGGEAAWKRAQGVWTQLTDASGTDPKLKGAVELLAADPADEDSLDMFRKTLGLRLANDPALRDTLVAALGGERGVQEMIARGGSRISGSAQQLQGDGRQAIQAFDNSVVENSTQVKH
ncbi:conserved hypothetical protein [Bradyrhizobium sp. ORS 375]|uniref:hypothetical protein n=1 Tax=Bradyrhizobium sp. (strain ORS 375) TaxID=566679 RepID=UPI0002408079|nr:hypothetical protein [Bradyrhizobium sp. ORS 375]CCD95766.1 conserved hypothetical protein [Bradyrhizobium sp. ORS 375]